MNQDVYISYSSKDKTVAEAACAAIESCGVGCWMAPRDIAPGRDWAESIIEAISGCRAMVLIFSAEANSSPQVLREVERAVNKGVPIIPVRIHDVKPSGSLEYFISSSHWLDAMTPPLEDHLARLAARMRTLIEAPRTADPKPDTSDSAAKPVPAARVRRPRRRRAALVGLSVVLVAVVGVTLWSAYPSKAQRLSEQGAEALLVRQYGDAVSLLTEALERDPELVQAYVKRAEAFIEMGEYENAVIDCDEAIARSPRNAAAYTWRGIAGVWLCDIEGAIRDTSRARQLDPESASVRAAQSLALFNKSDFDNAIAAAEEAVEIDPQCVWAQIALSLSYGMRWRIDAAREAAEAAIRANPDAGHAYIARGLAYSYVGRLDEALADADEALKRVPKNGYTHYLRASAHIAQGRLVEALKDANEAVRVDPSRALGYVERSLAHAMLGNGIEALNDANEAIQLDPNLYLSFAARSLAKCTLQQWDDALADAETAIELDKRSFFGHLVRGMANFGSGHHTAAIADYNSAITILPTYWPSYVGRGTVLLEQDEVEFALADFEKAIELTPCPVTYVSRARARFKQGDQEKARQDIAEALLRDPHSAEAYGLMVEMARSTEDWEEVLKQTTRALEECPPTSHELMHYFRGEAHNKLEAYDEAIADLSESVRLEPRDAANYELRGRVYSNTGRYSEAIADLEKAVQIEPTADRYGRLGEAYQESGDHENAVMTYGEQIRLDPDSAGAYFSRAVARVSAVANTVSPDIEQLRATADDIRQALGRKINDSDRQGALRVLLMIADLAKATGDNELHMELLQEVIDLAPEHAPAYAKRATFHMQQMDYETARADLDKASDLGADDADLWLGYAVCAAGQGNPAEAIEHTSKAIELAPEHAPTFVKRAMLHMQRMDYDAARADLDKARALGAEDADLLLNYARCASGQGNPDEAIEHASKAVELAPDNPAVYAARSQAYQAKGLVNECLADINQAVTLAPSSTQYRHWRAGVYLWTFNPNAALAELDEILKIEPQATWVLVDRGLCNLYRTRWSEALGDFDQFTRLYAKARGDVYFYRALAYWKLGDRKRYQQDRKKAVDWEIANGYPPAQLTVQSLSPGGVGQTLGIVPGDIILEYDGHQISRAYQLQVLTDTDIMRVSSRTLKIQRGSQVLDFVAPATRLDVTIVERPLATTAPQAP